MNTVFVWTIGDVARLVILAVGLLGFGLLWIAAKVQRWRRKR